MQQNVKNPFQLSTSIPSTPLLWGRENLTLYKREDILLDSLSVRCLVGHRDAGVMADPGQFVAGGRERHAVHPASSPVGELRHAGTKRHLLPPAGGLWLLLYLLHIGRKHPECEMVGETLLI